MEAYIDISYIFHFLLLLNSIRLMKIFTNKTFNKKSIILLSITSLVLYLNVLLYTANSVLLNTSYYLIAFYLIFKKFFIKPLFCFVFSYYSQLAIIRLFTNGIYLYKGVVMIYNPNSFFYILICPIIILIIEIITKSIKSLILLKKYRYKVTLKIKNKTYNLDGYFDSGNTLKFKDLPVVFLINELKDKKENYEKILINGIGKENSEYLKGKILFQNKERDVYFAYINKKSFNGCSCLLNVYLLG